jgi:chromosome segregation ATPase
MQLAFRRRTVLNFVPDWVQKAAVWTGGIIAYILITRSSAKRRVDEAVSAAKAELAEANRSLMESQSLELSQLHSEVSTLRSSINALTAINQRYGAAIAEKDLRIGELERDVRVRESRILQLESERHRH